jgi:Flp pilus assembly protein CpaB
VTKNPIIPILLAIATFALLALTLWPQEEPTAVVVVAARDLGAGSILTPADLKTVVLPLEQAPSDALADPTPLVGESLAVVRYSGEPVTPKHLGPAVVLAPDERGIAVRVEADTGLAGLLRPGMEVGVIATLESPVSSSDFGTVSGRGLPYAKSVLEGLRVLYVPPDFQARPAQPVVYSSETNQPVPSSVPPVREGVIVLAAKTRPEPIQYEEAEAILIRELSEDDKVTGGGGEGVTESRGVATGTAGRAQRRGCRLYPGACAGGCAGVYVAGGGTQRIARYERRVRRGIGCRVSACRRRVSIDA